MQSSRTLIETQLRYGLSPRRIPCVAEILSYGEAALEDFRLSSSSLDIVSYW